MIVCMLSLNPVIGFSFGQDYVKVIFIILNLEKKTNSYFALVLLTSHLVFVDLRHDCSIYSLHCTVNLGGCGMV